MQLKQLQRVLLNRVLFKIFFANVKKISCRTSYTKFPAPGIFPTLRKDLPTKNTPTRYSLMKNVLKISHSFHITSTAPRNNKIKRRELRVRQNIVKGHSKQAFCVLIMITCNYLIMVVFSSEFFLLIVVTACQIQRDLNT